jgi:putative hydrolase of the HAD superfamily
MVKNKRVIVFDLDDTLYKEIDFLRSAFKEIAGIVDANHAEALYDRIFNIYNNGQNAFQYIEKEYSSFSIRELLMIYRNHLPKIQLSSSDQNTIAILQTQGVLGIVTDGRSLTQRNKIKALGIDSYFKKIIISEEVGMEKPDIQMFKPFLEYNADEYYYIANDTKKDFIGPNTLEWTTICLLDSENKNIHIQDFSLDKTFLPKIQIHSLEELLQIV